MTDNYLYCGEVTLSFYDKNNNLKQSSKIKNQGTPWLFYVITRMLRDGYVHGEWDDRPGKLMLLDKDFNNCLRTDIYQNSQLLSEELGDGNDNPYIEYEFHLSYYNLLNTQGINDLRGYHLALLSGKDVNMSPISDNTSLVSEEEGSKIFNYKGVTKDTIGATIPPICALTTIKDNDTDYSLNEGEYISILWKMYFTNQVSTTANSGE